MARLKPLSDFVIEAVSLSTPRARLVFWALTTAVIFILPYRFFENLSLWKRLGWEAAPSVGLTRAYWLLIHGEASGAWARNKLIFVVIAVGLPILAIDVYKIINSHNNKP